LEPAEPEELFDGVDVDGGTMVPVIPDPELPLDGVDVDGGTMVPVIPDPELPPEPEPGSLATTTYLPGQTRETNESLPLVIWSKP
jgi:hypothetical protein